MFFLFFIGAKVGVLNMAEGVRPTPPAKSSELVLCFLRTVRQRSGKVCSWEHWTGLLMDAILDHLKERTIRIQDTRFYHGTYAHTRDKPPISFAYWALREGKPCGMLSRRILLMLGQRTILQRRQIERLQTLVIMFT